MHHSEAEIAQVYIAVVYGFDRCIRVEEHRKLNRYNRDGVYKMKLHHEALLKCIKSYEKLSFNGVYQPEPRKKGDFL